MEWDTGAAQAIASEARIQLQKYDNAVYSKYAYNKKNFLNDLL
ncbi:MAG: hypothetical protein U9N57_05890 [Pseudomonadota bacterium]|nr:hypothetical protein [Pseudomonadota bacterium]